MWQKLVSWGFRLLYHEMAFSYDLVANLASLGQWWAWQRAALAFLPPPADGWVLELAHGTGHLQSDLIGGGWQVAGCDLSAQMGRIAAARLHRQGLPARLARSKAQALPFPTGHFAAILCTFPTPFILETQTLQEARRILKPGGRLVFVPTATLTAGGVAKEALELAYVATGQRGGWKVDLQTHFAQAGLSLVQHQVQLARSQVWVLVASVPNEPAPRPILPAQ